jgi:hypothetical protein
MEKISIPLNASLFNSNDPADVSIVVDAVTLGTTRQLATGQTVTWDEAAMEMFAESFNGTPINALLNEQGELTDHSREVVGTVRKAVYDREGKKISVLGSLWNHYYPETIAALRELQAKGKVETSMEFLADELRDNGDGTVTPVKGRFSGLGLIPHGADKGNSVLLLASAIKEDKEENAKVTNTTSTALAGSYEWIGLKAAEHFANMGTTDQPYEANIIGTFNNAVVYNNGTDTFRMNYTSDTTNGVTFGEPVKVETTFVPLTASRKDDETLDSGVVKNMTDSKEFEELKASYNTLEKELEELRPIKTQFEELQAKVAKDEEIKKQELLASERIAEVEKIKPYDDEKLKEAHTEVFKTADEKTFETIKSLMASTVELKGGVADEAHAGTGGDRDPGEVEAEEKLPKWKEELLARYSTAETK